MNGIDMNGMGYQNIETNQFFKLFKEQEIKKRREGENVPFGAGAGA